MNSRFLVTLIVILVLCASARAKTEKVTVTVIDNLPTTTSYSWQIAGRATTNCYSSGCNSYFRPASSGVANVNGAVLRLLLPDSRIVIAKCAAKPDVAINLLSAMAGEQASTVYRDCRVPAANTELKAEFNRSFVRLSWRQPSIDNSGMATHETYQIVGILQPIPSAKRPSYQPEPGTGKRIEPLYAQMPSLDEPLSRSSDTSAKKGTMEATALLPKEPLPGSTVSSSSPGAVPTGIPGEDLISAANRPESAPKIEPSRIALQVSHEIERRTDLGLQLQANMAESNEIRFPTLKRDASGLNTEQALYCLIVTKPDGAEIDVDGVRTGQSPLFLRLLSKGAADRVVTLKKEGYLTVEKRFRPDGKDLQFDIDLVRKETKGFKVWPPEAQSR
jgi:hypothetical protein